MSRGQLGAKISLGMDPFTSFLKSLLFTSKNVAAVIIILGTRKPLTLFIVLGTCTHEGLDFGFPKQYLVGLSIIGSQAFMPRLSPNTH